jgi:hypothetical protein
VTQTVERVVAQPGVAVVLPNGARFGGTALLHTSVQIDIQQPEIDYTALAQGYAYGGREMPFRTVRILTTSARIRQPDKLAPSWLMTTNNEPVQFKIAAIDLEGNLVEFAMPLLYVPNTAVPDLIGIFRHPPPEVHGGARQVDLGGQEVAFARATTVLRTAYVDWDIEIADPLDPGGMMKPHAIPRWYSAPFLPRLYAASAVVPAVAELVGDASPQPFHLDDLYLHHDFNELGNAGQSFVQFETPIDLGFGAQPAGGIAQPRSIVGALSRTMGPIASGQKFADRKIDFSAFASAKFLGTIKLTDILPKIPPTFDPATVADDPPTSDQELETPGFYLEAPPLIARRFPDGAALPEWVEAASCGSRSSRVSTPAFSPSCSMMPIYSWMPIRNVLKRRRLDEFGDGSGVPFSISRAQLRWSSRYSRSSLRRAKSSRSTRREQNLPSGVR